MRLNELDIFHRCAQSLLVQHGDEAERRAAEKHDAHLAQGDADGTAVWQRILAAIVELRQDGGSPARRDR